jgi:DnaJ C terminal domain
MDAQVALEDIMTGTTKKMKITRRVLNPDGRTYRTEDKFLTLDIKPGWKAGTKVTFPREGDQAPNTIPADVVFVIRDKPHPKFSRDGSDIKYRAKVSLRQVRAVTSLACLKFQSIEFCHSYSNKDDHDFFLICFMTVFLEIVYHAVLTQNTDDL